MFSQQCPYLYKNYSLAQNFFSRLKKINLACQELLIHEKSILFVFTISPVCRIIIDILENLMNIAELRKLIGREEIDYQFLLSSLSDYAYPRDKITTWLKSGALIRIKKGLYIFGKETAITPFSPEVLANLIYGPSAISLNYALSFYGMIPERTTTITSITSKRDKTFQTPIGAFTYRYLTLRKYVVGIELFNANEKSPFLIASPEKALCDHIHLTDKKIKLARTIDVKYYLLNDLRVTEDALNQLRLKELAEITDVYQDKRLNILKTFIKEWQENA